MNAENKEHEAFKTFLVKQKRKSLFYLLLFIVALVVVVVLSLNNFRYKRELEVSKRELQEKLVVIQNMDSANTNYVEYQTRLTDSLQKAMNVCVNDLKSSREQLAAIGVTPKISVEEKKYIALEQRSRTLGSDLDHYKIGIYYYPGGENIANKIYNHLRKSGFKGQVQLYKEESDFFKKVGIPAGFEIRYERKLEDEVAFQLKNIMDSWGVKNQFRLRPVKNRTINFLSIFVPPATAR